MKFNKNEAGFTAVELIVCIAGLGIISLMFGGGYVMFHFIAKFW